MFSDGLLAVRRVNVKKYSDQIFALLGCNNAGKTTIISMLTGLIKRSKISVRCYEIDIFRTEGR